MSVAVTTWQKESMGLAMALFGPRSRRLPSQTRPCSLCQRPLRDMTIGCIDASRVQSLQLVGGLRSDIEFPRARGVIIWATRLNTLRRNQA